MKTLTLVVDERELSTIRAALFLLQEQVDMLPEDIADMMSQHGPPVSEAEIDHLSRHLAGWQDPANGSLAGERPRVGTLGLKDLSAAGVNR